MSENQIAVMQKNEVGNAVDLQTITSYLDAVGMSNKLLPAEKSMFINIAQLYGLNPFKREIYCNVYGEGQYRQCSIITGYEVYLKRAERLGKLDGWNATLNGSITDGSLSATVTIYRKDWSHPFTHTVYFREVCQTKKDGRPNRFWQTQPTFMTRKVAVAQAFRLCFPDEFGGMPYTNDEIGIEESAPQVQERNITPPTVEPVVEVNFENHTATAVETPKADCSSEREQLQKIVDRYGEYLKKSSNSPTPYEQAMTALNSGNPDEMANKAMRCIAWLGKQGIAVEA